MLFPLAMLLVHCIWSPPSAGSIMYYNINVYYTLVIPTFINVLSELCISSPVFIYSS